MLIEPTLIDIYHLVISVADLTLHETSCSFNYTLNDRKQILHFWIYNKYHDNFLSFILTLKNLINLYKTSANFILLQNLKIMQNDLNYIVSLKIK